MTETDIVLETKGLKKDFVLSEKEILSAVDNVSFTIRKKECLGVIGESGCGKSTVAKIISGVEVPTKGSIRFLGEEITGLRNREMKTVRRKMQIIFQNASEVVSPRMKIKSFLLDSYVNYRLMSKKDALLHISEMLKRVRLTDEVLKKYPHQVSGGELQRICIARAFALNPDFLICDEITSALDVSVQDEVMRLFRKMQKEYGTACLFICHDLALVNNYTDRVMVMYLGQVVEIIDSSKLGKEAKHPYTQALLQSVLFVSSDRESELKVLPGEPISSINARPGCRFCARCPKAKPDCLKKTPELKKLGENHFVACFRV